MDVRAAIRRTRLPFVASLLLAALLGVPATVEPAPVAGVGVVASPATADVTAAAPAAAEVTAAEPAETPVVTAFPVDAPPAGAGLTGRADLAALAPRAPPTV